MANTATSPDVTNNKTAKGFISFHIVDAQCQAILNTQFVAPTPKPDWFDGLNAHLDEAKKQAKHWLDDLGPRIAADIPASVVNYEATYSAVTDQIVTLIDSDPTAKGINNPTVSQTMALFGALRSEVDGIIAKMATAAADLNTWGQAMQKAHDDLFNGAASIQKAQSGLAADVAKMDSAIDGLHKKISGQNDIIAGMGILIGVSIFAMVVGIALAPVTGGASLIATGIGAVGVVGGAVTWGVLQDKIDSEYKEIAQDQAQRSEDQRQLVALQGLSLAARTAISSIETATTALADVKTHWAFFQAELQGVEDQLNDANADLMAIVNKAHLLAAQKMWKNASAFAQQLMGMTVATEAKVLPMHKAA